ncbi:hypothetical protein FGO68_gene14073 [Halteria grandinella]|uniref:Transmembrane protein n=1 Tax=Halteria grandinella TaxID=5974 RepID=A0A8J8NLJ6_HALGN|nr:hypothetical protein FGO68_gene14073 [Halteria grandinella]
MSQSKSPFSEKASKLVLLCSLLSVSLSSPSLLADKYHLLVDQANPFAPKPIPPGDFNASCFGCVMSNFKYCETAQSCIYPNTTCPNKTGAKGVIILDNEFTNLTGCPINDKCEVGLNGNWYLDTGNAAQGGLDTSVDSYVRLNYFNSTTISQNASKFPCSITIHNFPKKELTFQVSGPNVGVGLLTLNYPNKINKTNFKPYQPYSEFTIKPENSMAIVYLGSTASVGSKSEVGPATIQWINGKYKGAAAYGLQGMLIVLYISALALF